MRPHGGRSAGGTVATASPVGSPAVSGGTTAGFEDDLKQEEVDGEHDQDGEPDEQPDHEGLGYHGPPLGTVAGGRLGIGVNRATPVSCPGGRRRSPRPTVRCRFIDGC